MNLLFCCEFYYPSIGGVQEVVRQVAERMVGRGHSVTVATGRLRSREFKELNGVRIVEFDVTGNAARGMVGDLERYRQFVTTGGFDLMFIKAAQQWTLDALLPSLAGLKMKKVFVPCGFSGLYDPAYSNYFQEMPAILRLFDQLIFYANDYRDINFARSNGLSHFCVVPNGASEREFNVPRDNSFRRRHGIPDRAFLVLTVGNLNGYKGHRELADAFNRADFNGRKAYLLLNGNQPDEPIEKGRLMSMLQTLYREITVNGIGAAFEKIIKNIRQRLIRSDDEVRVGAGIPVVRELKASLEEINRPGSGKQARVVDLKRPDLIQAYLNSDLFVFASNVEYSPLVLFESAAAGLPFLSVPVGNAVEIAQWTGGGEICPARVDAQGYTRADPQLLAKHMEALAANPVKRKAYGETARQRWSEGYTWDKIASMYEKIFLELMLESPERAEANS